MYYLYYYILKLCLEISRTMQNINTQYIFTLKCLRKKSVWALPSRNRDVHELRPN